MRIEIKALGFKLTTALRTFIQDQLRQVLAWRLEAVRSVVIRLSDLNGPRGGEDKLCRIQVALPGGQLHFAQAARSDAYAAIIEASHRASRGVNRALDRRNA